MRGSCAAMDASAKGRARVQDDSVGRIRVPVVDSCAGGREGATRQLASVSASARRQFEVHNDVLTCRLHPRVTGTPCVSRPLPGALRAGCEPS